MGPSTDRIEKQVELRVPVARAWRAIGDSAEFGSWFGARFEDPFVRGARVKGRVTHPGFEHLTMELDVEELVPQRSLAFRWHPYAVDPKVDYSTEPTTRVEFRLEAAAFGTRVTIVESGFDQIPAARRAEAFRMNEGGWTQQVQNLAHHVERL
jgi:uncharacterized protein YndB with AHSA1/START domain